MASSICGDHWRESGRRQDAGAKGADRAQYMIVCNKGRAGLQLHWRKIWTVHSKKLNRWVQRSQYVKIGKDSYAYKIGSFRLAANWERDIIASIEKRLEPIRRECQWLARLAQLMANYPAEVEARRKTPKKATTKAPEAADLPEEAGW